MRRLLLAAAILGGVTSAHAADLSELPVLRGSYTEGLSSSRVNWHGYYVGGQVNFGSVTSNVPSGINSDMQATFLSPGGGVNYPFVSLGQAHQVAGGFGAFFGYNSQWDDVIVGIEGNYIHDGFRARTAATRVQYAADNVTVLSTAYSAATMKLSDFGSLRLRGGYIVGCFLPYAFVGVGIGDQTIDRTVSVSPDPLRQAWTTDSSSKLVYGYSAGAGFDVMLVAGLFARAEYEYRRITSNIESNIHTARLGLGYKF